MTWIPVDVSNREEVYAHFYIQVGTLKDPITKPIENQLNIVTTLVTRIKEWKSRSEWKVLYSCLAFTDIFMHIVLSNKFYINSISGKKNSSFSLQIFTVRHILQNLENTIVDTNVKNNARCMSNFRKLPSKAGFTQDTPPSPPKTTLTRERWGEGSPWCQIHVVGLLWVRNKDPGGTLALIALH